MRKLLIAVLLVVPVGACSSSAPRRSSNVTDIYVRQLGMIYFGSGYLAPVTLEVDVTNLSRQPLRLRRITVASPGMATYTIETMGRTFKETIEPGRVFTARLFGNARTSSPRGSRFLEPLGVRVIAEFEGAEGRFQEIHMLQAEMGAQSAIR